MAALECHLGLTLTKTRATSVSAPMQRSECLPSGHLGSNREPRVPARNTGVLLFRLSLAPQTFSKCIYVALITRLQNIQFMNYLDDWLVHSECPAAQYQDIVLKLLKDLGLRVNWDKSILLSHQQICFLALELDSVAMRASLASAEIAITLAVCTDDQGQAFSF